MTDKVNEPIQLHVGYVGESRGGKRAEIVRKSGVKSWPWACNDEKFYRDDGGFGWKNEQNYHDIIGPWTEDEAKDSVDTPADYVHPTQEDYNAVMETNRELVRQLAACQTLLAQFNVMLYNHTYQIDIGERHDQQAQDPSTLMR